MKQNKNNNSWLDEIRDEMLDFKADIPANGWERVSSALPEKKNRSYAIRWWGAAASVLLCIGIGSGLLMLNNSNEKTVAEVAKVNTIGNTNQQIEEQPAAEQTKNEKAANSEKPRKKEAPTKIEVPTDAHHDDNLIAESTQPADTTVLLAENNTLAVEEKSEEPVRNNNFESYNSDKDEHLLAIAYGQKAKHGSGGWSFGVNIGANGDLSGGQDMYEYSGERYEGHYLLSPFPNTDRFLLFNNKPDNADKIIDSDHHVSWSAGLSVGKEILPRMSLETGLTYTLLTSDVHSLFNGWQQQAVHYLGVPLRMNYMLLGSKSFQLYAGGGAMLEHSLHATRGGKTLEMNPWQGSANIAIGGQYMLTDAISVYIEPGVSWYFCTNKDVPTLCSESPVYFNLRGGLRLSYQ